MSRFFGIRQMTNINETISILMISFSMQFEMSETEPTRECNVFSVGKSGKWKMNAFRKSNFVCSRNESPFSLMNFEKSENCFSLMRQSALRKFKLNSFENAKINRLDTMNSHRASTEKWFQKLAIRPSKFVTEVEISSKSISSYVCQWLFRSFIITMCFHLIRQMRAKPKWRNK